MNIAINKIGYFTAVELNKKHFLLVVLIIGIIATSFFKIFCSHELRKYHFKIDKTQHNITVKNIEYSKLLLEKTTLMSDLKVEKVAKDLNMSIPNKIIMVKPWQKK